MEIHKALFVMLIAILLLGCNNKSEEIVTNNKDYYKYINNNENEMLAFAEAEMVFWQDKYHAAKNQYTYLSKIAAAYSLMFQTTGNVDYLYKTESLLKEANERTNYEKSSLLRALAHNYISQHRFREALALVLKAYDLGEGKAASEKMLFDVYLELGDYDNAEKHLLSIKNMEDFDFLIRLAKWNDHKGDLSTAIRLLEKAVAKAEEANNKTLKLWAYSNIADYYGHAGRIKESYRYYLKTLSIDPDYTYALKGIAWIAFSHEKNVEEANRVLNAITLKHNSPDYYLLKAELADYAMDEEGKMKNIEVYFAMLNANDYGKMYNHYNAILYTDELHDAKKALKIARQEIENRPTTESYDLWAWAEYNLGNKEKALQIVKEHIEGKTFEPNILYHMAIIYKENGHKEALKPLKKALQGSIFELGPNMEESINSL